MKSNHLLLLATFALALGAAPERPNVLFIAIDDQNDWIGALSGHPQVKTPHIDGFAARGTLFTNAHCQAPLCNPSRASVLTGMRPSTTGIYGLAPGIRDVELTKDLVTLPQTFTQAGYFTFATGKIYHDGSIRSEDYASEFEVPGPIPRYHNLPPRIARLRGEQHPLMDWGPYPGSGQDLPDYKIASAAVDALQSAPPERPFFIAAGFRLPHVPLFVPQEWFDLYPGESLVMPPVQPDDRADTPHFSWLLHWRLPEPRLVTLQQVGEWRPLVRAYLASVSFMDAQVGRLLQALEESGRSRETIVVLWSDHGYHLGEKAISGKNTLWERSTRVPLIFAGPGIAAGARCESPVELLDIFPTLLDLVHLPTRSDLEGLSLSPQLKDARAARRRPAITTHNRGNHAIRDEQWRYIRYADGSEELYDLKADPNEWNNLAEDPNHAQTKLDLARWIPKQDRPPAPGSAHRVLTYDAETGGAVWEGSLVPADEPIPIF